MSSADFKSRQAINDLYADHLESLLLSGVEFDEAGLRADWQAALDEFDATH